MFPSLRRLFGAVSAREEDGVIYVEGVETYVMLRDIQKLWGSSRIQNNMFIKIGSSSFSFPSFFALDVLYTLQKLVEKNSLYVSVKTLTKIIQELLENTWIAKINQPTHRTFRYENLQRLTYTPKDFQQGFFEEYDRIVQQFDLRGMLFAGTAGSGKTFTSIAWAELRDAPTVYVVCPLNAVSEVWAANILAVHKKKQSYWLSTQGGEPRRSDRFIVAHYEALPKLLEIAKKRDNRDAVIILDESHNLNEVTSLRTERFQALCDLVNSRDVVWLSGTPIKALATEAIPLFRCIDPRFTKDVEERFKKIYAGAQGKALEIINHRLGKVTYKVEKKALELAPPVILSLPVKMPDSIATKYTLEAVKIAMQQFIAERNAYYAELLPQYQKVFYAILETFEQTLGKSEWPAYEQYRSFLKTIIKLGGSWECKDEMAYCSKYEKTVILPRLEEFDRKEFKATKSVVKYYPLVIQGECLGRIVGGLRQECHVELARYIDYKALVESTKKKVICFTSFVPAVELMAQRQRELGYEPGMVYAKTTHQLSSIMKRYKEDPAFNPLNATYKSLSTAVPVIEADTMLLLDAPFRDYQLQQTISRCHRLGQDSTVTVYTAHLDTGAVPNISTRSYDILRWSQQMVADITGVKPPFEIADEVGEDGYALEDLHEDLADSDGFDDAFGTMLDWGLEAYHAHVPATDTPKALCW